MPCIKNRPIAVTAVFFALSLIVSHEARPQTDCRPRTPEPRAGALDLTGEWMDNSVGLKVDITQNGDNLYGSADISAKYKTPYKCAYGSSRYAGHTAVLLDQDLSGQLKKNVITGVVYICQSETQSVVDRAGTSLPIPGVGADTHVELYSREVTGPLSGMTVSDDGNTIQGKFTDPSKGIQDISFTRLSKQDRSQYKNFGVLETTATTNIYKEPSTGAAAAYQVPSGTRLLFDDVKLDEAGGPIWYHVANSPGAGSQYSRNFGWVRASHITCSQPKPPGKVGP